jgi:RNA polymerase sigma-70 factor (ECF subfamily)
MLGSLPEAEDAVQEAWLRLNRIDVHTIENLEGWLVTVVTRICMDALRSRKTRAEELLDEIVVTSAVTEACRCDPEQEAIMAQSVGLALLVVLDRLAPAERLAFVLHDMFAVSFEEISSILKRTPASVRQLASRARKRVQSPGKISATMAQQKDVIDAFLRALRAGDMAGVLAVLDPAVVRRADQIAVPEAADAVLSGSTSVAKEAVTNIARARFAQTAIVDGAVGIIVAPRGKLAVVLLCKVLQGKIIEFDVIADPDHLRTLDIVPYSE